MSRLKVQVRRERSVVGRLPGGEVFRGSAVWEVKLTRDGFGKPARSCPESYKLALRFSYAAVQYHHAGRHAASCHV